MTWPTVLDRRHDGFYLVNRKLALMDELEVDLPMVGWCRGRFGVVHGIPILVLRNGSGDRQVRLDADLFYGIRWPEDTPSFTCPSCKRVSYNPNDVRERYCSVCHEWFA